MNHLTDTELQGLADGTLRGPDGLAARDHCDECEECNAELQLYSTLSSQLSALSDPLPPPDFTTQVLAAVETREQHLLSRRHTLLAAIPAAALALVAVVGWALSSAPAAHLDRLVEGWTVARHVVGAAAPVVAMVRLPLALGAFVFLAAVLVALSRALRPEASRATAS